MPMLKVVDEADDYTSAVAGVTIEGARVGRGVGPNVVLPVPGTELTVKHALNCGKPLLVIEPLITSIECAQEQVAQFCLSRGVRSLNVAGPRASEESTGYEFALRLVLALIRLRCSGDHV